MRITPLVLPLSLLVLSSACGGPGSFDGTVHGVALQVKESIFYRQAFSGAIPGQSTQITAGSIVAVLMADQTGLCARLQNAQGAPNATAFLIGLTVTAGGLSFSDALTTGQYRLIGPLDFFSTPPAGTRLTLPALNKTDPQCNTVLNTTIGEGIATAGTVTLNGFTAGKSASGTFDLQFGADSGKGSFNATFCDYTPPNPAPTPTCQ